MGVKVKVGVVVGGVTVVVGGITLGVGVGV